MICDEILRDVIYFEEHTINLSDKIHVSSGQTQKNFALIWNRVIVWKYLSQTFLSFVRMNKSIKKTYKAWGISLDYPMSNLPHCIKLLSRKEGENIYEFSGVIINKLEFLPDIEIKLIKLLNELGMRLSVCIVERRAAVIHNLLDAIKDVYLALDALYGPHKDDIAVLDRDIENLLSHTA